MDSWDQDNSFPKVFIQAVRGGYPTDRLLAILTSVIERRQAANLRIADTWHGIEKSGATEAINSMLVQSVDSVITVFPAWPSERDAAFEQLRQKGGFLVSSQRDGGEVVHVDVVSTVGGILSLRNPWSGRTARLSFKGSVTQVVDDVIAVTTVPGDRLRFIGGDSAAGRAAVAMPPG